jgi:predicted N-acyltransferase
LWENRSYADFDDFCVHLTTKRRKMVRAEQRKVREQAISCAFIEGANIARDDWAFFYACYAATYQVRGREPYLSLAFFEQLGQTMAHQLVLEVATHESGERVAAALFFKDAQTLYGRYWGALYDVSCLHFEVCYYQGIAYAIAQGVRYFDPGTQGEHKLARGFAPVFTHSLHWLADAGFMRAVQDFVARERHGVSGYLAECVANLPFKLKDSEP